MENYKKVFTSQHEKTGKTGQTKQQKESKHETDDYDSFFVLPVFGGEVSIQDDDTLMIFFVD